MYKSKQKGQESLISFVAGTIVLFLVFQSYRGCGASKTNETVAEKKQIKVNEKNVVANDPPPVEKFVEVQEEPELPKQVAPQKAAVEVVHRVVEKSERAPHKKNFTVVVDYIGEEERLPTEEELAAISRKLIRLGPDTKISFVMFYMKGEDTSEIAFATGHHNPDLEVHIVRQPDPPSKRGQTGFGLTETQRRQFFLENLLIEDNYVEHASEVLEQSRSGQISNDVRDMKINEISATEERSKAELLKKYNLTDRDRSKIIMEAVNNQWPQPVDKADILQLLDDLARSKVR